MPRPEFSVCVLLFGGYTDLSKRCLGSIENSHYEHNVQDFRIALNSVSAKTHRYAMDWASRQSCPTIFYYPFWDGNPALKYPIMRKMFQDKNTPLARTMMWFDDDSYLADETQLGNAGNSWWSDMVVTAQKNQVIGQVWKMPMTARRWEWILTQWWYNPEMEYVDRVDFPQGAWWCANSDLLAELNWPDPRLHHCGGDSLFGEMCRHSYIKIHKYEGRYVRVNADAGGTHSKAARRGFSQTPLADDYEGDPLPLAPVPDISRWVHRGT